MRLGAGAPPAFGQTVTGYASAPALRAADPASLQHLTGETMGTTWSLRVDNPRMLALHAIRQAVQSALDAVVEQMSHWHADSALGRFNRAAPGTTHRLPDGFATVLTRALHWADASGGALDPTMGPLVGLWGFGPDAVDEGNLPPPSLALAAARARCGWKRLRYDSDTRTLTQPGGLSLDLSGIAKGYGVDAGADALQALGLTDFLLEVGGELRGVGRRPGGRAWRVRIDPGFGELADESSALVHVELAGEAIATSGERWHTREADGRRWSHTLDPRTGEPVAHAVASVTVRHPRCMDADALATVLTVLGPDDGMAFADHHRVAALWAERMPDGRLQLRASAAWAQPGHEVSPTGATQVSA